jgi:cephalosporin-C deacetylase
MADTAVDDREFHRYWQTLRDELDSLPPAAEETEIPLRSDEHCTCCGVRLTSCGPYRIFGYLCIPKRGDGPFPAYYYLPRYQSVVEVVPQGLSVDVRRECVTFAVACRGQRMADRPLIGEFPGMLTGGIDDAETYPMRGWVADCIRGLQYLQSRPEVDAARIAAAGFNDFALITAALAGGLRCVTATPGLFLNSRELLPTRHACPLQEFHDDARRFPDRAEGMYRTLSYFDPLRFADRISIPALLWGGLPWGLHPVEDLRPLAERIGPTAELQATVGSRSQDGILQEHWLARQLGLVEPVLPEHWR